MKSDVIWPYSIVAFFAVAICAFVAYAVFSIRHSVDLVSDDYYAQEIAYQQRIDSLGRAHALPERPRWEHEASPGRLALSFPPGLVERLPEGSVTFYRASDKRLDREVPLALEPDGRQHIATVGMVPGLWQVQLRWTMDGESYYLEEAVILP
jgi:nitrogen fixation protein FixH